MSIKRFYASWSFSQQAIQIEEEAEALAGNLDAFVRDEANDFVPLGVFNSHDQAREFGRQILEIRNRRQGGTASWG